MRTPGLRLAGACCHRHFHHHRSITDNAPGRQRCEDRGAAVSSQRILRHQNMPMHVRSNVPRD